ncbi:Putative sensor-like histidine kinase YfhK, partial [Salmonella enterica subsp. enterica serovar Rubislaw str. A4-653]
GLARLCCIWRFPRLASFLFFFYVSDTLKRWSVFPRSLRQLVMLAFLLILLPLLIAES